jgi:hypothetical protein
MPRSPAEGKSGTAGAAQNSQKSSQFVKLSRSLVMLSILLDIEWLLSTLFDASLLTFEPPATAAPFFLLSRFGPPAAGRRLQATSAIPLGSAVGVAASLLGHSGSRGIAQGIDLAATSPAAGPWSTDRPASARPVPGAFSADFHPEPCRPAMATGCAGVAARQLCPNLRCAGAGHRVLSRAMLSFATGVAGAIPRNCQLRCSVRR